MLKKLQSYGFDHLYGNHQHGFRKGHGTDTAISSVVNHLTELTAQGHSVLCYSADLTAAFDLLRKDILAEILLKRGLKLALFL